MNADAGKNELPVFRNLSQKQRRKVMKRRVDTNRDRNGKKGVCSEVDENFSKLTKKQKRKVMRRKIDTNRKRNGKKGVCTREVDENTAPQMPMGAQGTDVGGQEEQTRMAARPIAPAEQDGGGRRRSMRLEQAHQSHININMDAETPVSAEEDKVIDILKDLDEQSRDRYRSYWENRMVLNLFYGMQLENIKRGQPMSRTALEDKVGNMMGISPRRGEKLLYTGIITHDSVQQLTEVYEKTGTILGWVDSENSDSDNSDSEHRDAKYLVKGDIVIEL